MHFFDSSVLVAAFDSSDVFHKRGWVAFEKHGAAASVALHSLAEVFSVLTGRRGIRPSAAFEVLRANTGGLKKVFLTPAEYERTLQSADACGIRGGAIYDALILACARKANASTVWTFNARNFLAFSTELRDAIREP